mmetsp:Transcript_19111/g.39409  ORF Transcript_19111/g.39409 Transcript_19111/m.39409 type:complete len:212 (+) Transcript_19111:198-833(+)
MQRGSLRLESFGLHPCACGIIDPKRRGRLDMGKIWEVAIPPCCRPPDNVEIAIAAASQHCTVATDGGATPVRRQADWLNTGKQALCEALIVAIRLHTRESEERMMVHGGLELPLWHAREGVECHDPTMHRWSPHKCAGRDNHREVRAASEVPHRGIRVARLRQRLFPEQIPIVQLKCTQDSKRAFCSTTISRVAARVHNVVGAEDRPSVRE